MKQRRSRTKVIPLNPGVWDAGLEGVSFPESEDGSEPTGVTEEVEEFPSTIRTLFVDLYPVLLAFTICLPASGQL